MELTSKKSYGVNYIRWKSLHSGECFYSNSQGSLIFKQSHNTEVNITLTQCTLTVMTFKSCSMAYNSFSVAASNTSCICSELCNVSRQADTSWLANSVHTLWRKSDGNKALSWALYWSNVAKTSNELLREGDMVGKSLLCTLDSCGERGFSHITDTSGWWNQTMFHTSNTLLCRPIVLQLCK